MSMTGKYGGFVNQAFTAELYDVVYAGRNNIDVGFFVDYSLKAIGKTLELGCGTGRVLIPVAEAGCGITGLDISTFMLEKCRQKLSSEPEEVRKRVNLMEGDITAFHTGDQYSLITLPFRIFHYLISIEEQKACLNCVYRHLYPDGIVILDLFNCYPPLMHDPMYLEEQEDQRDLQLPGNKTLRCTGRIAEFHRDRQYNDTELIYYISHPDGKTERLVQAFPFRYFFRYEVEHLLELCGFQVIDLFGNFDKSAFSSRSPQMIFVARMK
ncbi:MAG: class I SAM-dependent methyltransferase [Dehalococcoidales bacterium]|nr:class I SAM-dependent methyltransferase [Dehalococcoidales bacterium]